MSSPRRLPALVVLSAVLAAGALADRAAREAPASTGPAEYVQPVAEPVSSLASTWYCVGASSQPGTPNNGRVVIANPTTTDVSGRVTLVPTEDAGAPTEIAVEVPARSAHSVVLSDIGQAGAVAAIVELDGGGVGVELNAEGPPGRDDVPCHSGASDRWFFPEATTVKDARLSLALFNPFPDDAVVDVAFATEEGAVTPRALQAVLVKGRSVVNLDVSAQVQRKQQVATSVVARTGRLVATEVLVLDGSEGRVGIDVVEGSPSLGREWSFPDGFVMDGITARYVVYNPGDLPAEVEVFVALERGGAEPAVVDVPARSSVVALAGDDSRIPKSVSHAVTIRSTNDVEVVAARSLVSNPPAPRRGFAVTLGSRVDARRWLLPEGVATEFFDEWVVVMNPGTTEVVVSFTGLAAGRPLPVAELQDVTVEPGRRRSFRLGDHVERNPLPLLVEASAPVIVERSIYVVKGPGISQTIGIPLP